MSRSLNKVILIGNLGRDPEVRQTQDGTRIASLSVATSEQWKDKATDERKERVEWHKVVIFNPRLVEYVERFMKKGQMIYVEGKIESRKWTDQQNQEHRTQEVVLRYKGEISILDGRVGASDEGSSRMDMDPGSGGGGFDAMHDEIPF